MLVPTESRMSAPNFIDLTGRRFGNRLVLYFDGSRGSGKNTKAFWHVRCDCGRENTLSTSNLKISVSCGCQRDAANSGGLKRRKLTAIHAVHRGFQAAHLRRRFGLTLEQWDAMLVAQNGSCKLCRIPFKHNPHVDHCHVTGVVRGLLCHHCNTGIGNLRDDPQLLREAAAYLESFGQHMAQAAKNAR